MDKEGYHFGTVVAYYLARCKNTFCMHESTGKSITQYITNNIFYSSNNVAIMTEMGRLAIQYQLLPTINYSFCDYVYGPYLKQWSRSNDL